MGADLTCAAEQLHVVTAAPWTAPHSVGDDRLVSVPENTSGSRRSVEWRALHGLAPHLWPAGNVGVVSHSGGLGQINVMWRAQEIGLGISYEASVGNEADLDSLDFARFMLRSEATDVVFPP